MGDILLWVLFGVFVGIGVGLWVGVLYLRWTSKKRLQEEYRRGAEEMARRIDEVDRDIVNHLRFEERCRRGRIWTIAPKTKNIRVGR